MSSEITMVAEQCRLHEWAAQIRDCLRIVSFLRKAVRPNQRPCVGRARLAAV